MSVHYREAIAEYIHQQARPIDKYSHQPRIYQLAAELGAGLSYDDDVLYAAAWLHDLGVFIGHRPEEPEALQHWDNIAYVLKQAPGLLAQFGFPAAKIPAVLDAIAQHLPSGTPSTTEAILLRDADLLEQLGAIIILRTTAKVGRDTRFHTFSDVIESLKRNLATIPSKLHLEQARHLAAPRIAILEAFLAAAEAEALGIRL